MSEETQKEFLIEKTTINLSKSRIETALSCVGKYYFGYIKKVEIDKGRWSTTFFGEALHQLIEDFFNEYKVNPDLRENVDKIVSAEGKKKLDQKLLKKYNLHFELAHDKKKKELADNNIKIVYTKKFPEKEMLKTGDKWAVQSLDFLTKFFNSKLKDLNFDCEKDFNVPLDYKSTHIYLESDVDKSIEADYAFKGFVDFRINNSLVDFKTTSNLHTYYFVDWKMDLQSNIYNYAYYMTNQKLPDDFSYMVFSPTENVIFVTKNNVDPVSIQTIITVLKSYAAVFFQKHILALQEDTAHYSPSYNNCTFCDFKKICKVSRAKK